MLFGVKLQSEIYAPWSEHYIDYDRLKLLLKENIVHPTPTTSTWSANDESAFAELLDSEIDKVYSFQVSKYKELDDEITALEMKSESYLELFEQSKPDPSFNPTEFQQKLEELLSLANELDHFARLNFTGFIKIVKKHDRLHKGYSVKALLNVRMKELPVNNISEDTSPYLFRISTLYTFIRDQVSAVSLGSSLSDSLQNSFNRLSTSGKLSTTPAGGISESHHKVLKFWVHPDNLMEIKTTILRHLPVLIYNSGNEDDDDDDTLTDSTITSLYFDSRNFELYNNKLLKQLNKTPSLRIMWNGKLRNNSDLSIEKRIFDYDTGKSNDIKLSLKEKYMNDFIFPNESAQNPESDDDFVDYRKSMKKKASKKFDLSKFKQRLQKKGISKDKIDAYTNSFKTLQSFISQNHLEPVLRAVYSRTAFQMPGDDKVRITIDSDILFIREDSFDEQRPIRDPREWHRNDIDSSIDNPYSLLRRGEYTKFPYSLMEMKVSSSIMQNASSRTMAWINELTNSHLVKEVPNFSKFVHGTASLFLEDENLDILPFWLPELDSDIRKNPEQAYADSRNKRMKELQQAEVLKNLKKKIATGGQVGAGALELSQIDEGDDLDESSDDDKSSPTPPPTAERLPNTNSSPITPPPSAPTQSNKIIPLFTDVSDTPDTPAIIPPGVVVPKTLIRQSGPVRVEAKVWLANERTFIRWLHVTTLLTALTFTLPINLSYVYAALSIFTGIWAWWLHGQRRDAIAARSGEHLDNVIGPLVVSGALLLALATQFYTGVKKWKDRAGVQSLSVESEVTNWALELVFSLVE